ncbi:MAG: GNAT family N-acetyltransferase [Nocardioides sp.]|nr:GNAT family N-acetyltransferase [Nocardioides sp.]
MTAVGYGDPDAAALVEAVQEEYVVRYGERDATPVVPADFDPPAGTFLVAHLGDRPVASGAWRRREMTVLGESRVVEVKRMYVAPEGRRRGLARQVLAALEASARESGARAVVLETGVRQPEAIALYESCGYQRIPAYGHYKDDPLCVCFARRLG